MTARTHERKLERMPSTAAARPATRPSRTSKNIRTHGLTRGFTRRPERPVARPRMYIKRLERIRKLLERTAGRRRLSATINEQLIFHTRASNYNVDYYIVVGDQCSVRSDNKLEHLD